MNAKLLQILKKAQKPDSQPHGARLAFSKAELQVLLRSLLSLAGDKAAEDLLSSVLNTLDEDYHAKDRAALIRKARDEYQNDDVEIDNDAALSRGDDGTWVQAWVNVQTQE